jgi:DNA-binding CsgD family transcriptional regulator
MQLIGVELRRIELDLGRGEHAAAAERLARLEEPVAGSAQPQWHAPYGALTAELRRREGDLDAARAAVEDTLDRIEFCTEDVARLARVAAAGVSVEADRALRDRDLGDDAGVQRALATLEDLLRRVEAAAAGGMPVEQAWLATARADAARARGADAAGAWRLAAEAWTGLDRPYLAAVAFWREAEAHAAGERRSSAAEVLRPALETAHRLGADWLASEIDGLAQRARLDLAEEPSAPPATAPDAEQAPFGLTPRERQVLALVADGATNREIGTRLYMAEKTASVHVSRILAKLDVRSRTQAAAVAHRLGLTT